MKKKTKLLKNFGKTKTRVQDVDWNYLLKVSKKEQEIAKFAELKYLLKRLNELLKDVNF